MSGNNLYMAWIDRYSGNRDIFFRKSVESGKNIWRYCQLE